MLDDLRHVQQLDYNTAVAQEIRVAAEIDVVTDHPAGMPNRTIVPNTSCRG